MNKQRITCGITMGDAAGIGPEVVLKALNDKSIQKLANFIVIGNSSVLKKTARLSKIKLQDVTLLEVGSISKLVFGSSVEAYGALALDCLKQALRLIEAKSIDVLVTAPVNKHTITEAGYKFLGHTEYLAKACNLKNFAMMLVGGPLRVTLVTRHIALKNVARSLTVKKIYEAICLTAHALKKYFGISRPRIGVCALNPHSGEEGIMGQEEKRIIQPAILKARSISRIAGPLPADSLFYSAFQNKFDAVIAMYHDQGLIPLKMLAFHQGVNLTLGLPFIRTSPDHGSAYDIAGKNKANPGSMIEAIKLAVKIGLKIKKKAQGICY